MHVHMRMCLCGDGRGGGSGVRVFGGGGMCSVVVCEGGWGGGVRVWGGVVSAVWLCVRAVGGVGGVKCGCV